MRGQRLGAFGLALLIVALPAAAAPPPLAPAEAAIRDTLSRWYEELAKREEGRTWDIVAPGFIDASPPVYHVKTGSRAAGPRVHASLAAQALKFDWEVERIRRDSIFARVDVWERGYFYAWAAQKTYERAAATTFILERREKDGRWRIVAHQSGSYGIPPNKVSVPMPDLRDLYYSTEGKSRESAADARRAAESR
ncbi:MAG: hypothetical protein ACXWUQ_02835 [Allosphingosinicella sp.]